MKLKIIGIGLLAVGLMLGAGYTYRAATEEIVTTTISGKERECISQDCRYVVYTTDEVFENRDSWWYLKFNSSDYHNKLVPGKEYRLTVYGFRVGFLSWYRNIVDYEQVN